MPPARWCGSTHQRQSVCGLHTDTHQRLTSSVLFARESQLGPPAPGLQKVLSRLQAEYARCDTVMIGIHVRFGGAEFTAQQPHELPYEDQREYLFGSLEYAPDSTIVPSPGEAYTR
jgi:hypothetical protein